jgi:bile acid-coenzyme A ligase
MQAMTAIRGTDFLQRPGSVGRAIAGEIKIARADGTDAAVGEVGEVFMRRADGTPETYRYVGAQARTLPDGWESLGDMGSMDADGYLYLADRSTDMILVGGANIYPAEIEAALENHPHVLSAVVVGLPDDDLGQRLHAVIEAPASIDLDSLQLFLRAHVEPHKLPRSYRIVDHPLRDDAGKVRRSTMRDEERARLGLSQPVSTS